MKRTAFIISILLFSISAFAQTQKFDVMTYTPPKGWTQGQSGSAKTFTIIDKASGKFCIMMLHPSITNHGTPSQDFDYVWKTLVQETFKSGENPETQTIDSDGFTINQGGELIEFEGNKALAMLTTVSGKGKIISLLAIFNDAKYADDVQAFLGAIDVDIPESASTKKPITSSPEIKKTNNLLTDNAIAGVWTCYRNSPGLTNLSWYYKVFFSNGKSLDVMPQRGLFDYNITTESNLDVGRYSFANGKGSNFKSDAARVDDKLLLLKANQLKIDNYTYWRSQNVSGGRINASFTSFGDASDPTIKTLPYGEKPVITFTKDGRFKDEGLFNTYLFDKGMDEAAAKPGNGTYELQDFSIILTYDDGRQRQEAFVFAFSTGVDDGSIILMKNGAQLNKIQ